MTDYSLQAELDAKLEESGGMTGPIKMQVDDATNQSHDTEIIPKVGEKAPLFEINDDKGHTIRLTDLLEKGPVVLSFFRGGWCEFCKIEMKALQRFSGEFQKHSATLVGISPSTISVQEFSKGEITVDYAILSDTGNAVSKKYGLSYNLSNELDDLLGGFGLDFSAINGTPPDESNHLSIPGTFVLSRQGDVVFAYWDYDHTKRAEPTEIIASLMSIS